MVRGSRKRYSLEERRIMCQPKVEGGMGFQDLETFNFTHLAKQVWRLMKSSESLVARVLRAKYHAQTDFLEAKIYSRVSYAWRSILETPPVRIYKINADGALKREKAGVGVFIWDH